MSFNVNVNKTNIKESVERLADKESTSEHNNMETTPIPIAAGVAPVNTDGTQLSEEDENWITPGRDVDFSFLMQKSNHLKELQGTQKDYIKKLEDIVDLEVVPKLLKNNPKEVKDGVSKITQLIGFMKSNMQLMINTNKNLAKGINVIRDTGDLLRRKSLPPKDKLRRGALFQDSKKKGLVNVSENSKKRRASSPLSSKDSRSKTNRRGN